MTSLGERIRELRVKANLDQEDIAFALERAQATISNYEKGSREPSFTDLKKLHDVLSEYIGDNFFYLVTGEKNIDEYQHKAMKTRYLNRAEAIATVSKFISDMVDLKEIKLRRKLMPGDFAQALIKHCFEEQEGV